MEDLFSIFLHEWSLRSIQQAFYQLCVNRGVDPTDSASIYEKLKLADRFCEKSSKPRQLWELLDKRREQKVYQNQNVCRDMNVLIVGGGPCGLRTAIECALLGANVVVAEGRDKFTRNNVLHLWKFVIEDLKALGAKIFMPRFCTGSIEHICIRKLQFILLKVALVLGVQFYDNVKYVDLIEPQRDKKGWRATFEPRDHVLSDFEFDVIIGASGKQKCLPTFKHNVVRGKLALGITVNFVHHRTKQENDIPELQGVAYVYRQHFFDELQRTANIKLENIVYYKSETHYFVMCAEKQNLIAKGVIKRDVDDIKLLLDKSNIDTEMLCKYLTQVVDYATEHKLQNLEFALNARRQPDVAVFDFTELSSADHSTRFIQYEGHPLILSLVGDYLHEPFWPTGTGCARGFLSVLDTAWLIRGIGVGKEPMSKLLAEREATYSLLSQTQPNNLSTAFHRYTIDPAQRYKGYRPILPRVDDLMGVDDKTIDLDSMVMKICRQRESCSQFSRKASLFRFCYMAVQSQRIRISSFNAKSWADGRALSALISKYKPDFKPSVDTTNPAQLCLESFLYAEKHLAIPRPCVTHYEWTNLSERARAAYLQNLFDVLRADPFQMATMCLSPTLFNNYNLEKALESAKQARVLRPKDLTDPKALNFEILSKSMSVTKRQKKTINDLGIENIQTKPLPKRRSSVDPLNPELLMKLRQYIKDTSTNEVVDSSVELVPTNEEEEEEETHPISVREVCHEIEEGTFAHSPEDTCTPSRLDQTLRSGSLAGVRTVTTFREKFDSTPTRKKEISQSTNSSDFSSDDHPADPMNVRPTVVPTQTSNGVVYRSSTQHQFGCRPLSVPQTTALDSPDLCQTFGHRKPLVTAAQQVVYTNVQQRRMKLCALCNQDVYLAEQLIVDRLSIHKRCFRCGYCSRPLNPGAAFIDRELGSDGPRWYCQQHHRLTTADKLSRLHKTTTKSSTTASVAVVSPTKSKTAVSSQLSYAEKTFVPSSAESTASSSNSLNEIDREENGVHSMATQTRPSIQHSTQTTPRPATPPRKAMRPSTMMLKKRLSDVHSPTQLIEACRERTTQRLVAIGMQTSIDENKDTISGRDIDGHSNGSFEDTSPPERRSTDGEEESDLDEYVDAENDLSFDEEDEADETWHELQDFLERTLVDSSPTTTTSESSINQARELIETFNRRSLLNHFGGSKEPQVPSTPFFTPRQHRSDTTPDTTLTEEEPDFFVTPRTHMQNSKQQTAILRRSSTMERRDNNPEVDQLKEEIQQNAGSFDNKRSKDQLPPSSAQQRTPKRFGASRPRRGPRRATVAVDLKRESLGPEDGVATANVPQTPTTTRVRRSPSVQRARALHIRPTEQNLDRVCREIDAVRTRRQHEKERQLQAVQRRLQEVEFRIEEVCKVGLYLERALCKDRRNAWELEQWLIYSQQYEELQFERQQLKLKMQIAQLDTEYKERVAKLHEVQQKSGSEGQQTEQKRLMELLLSILNKKDELKAELQEAEEERRPRTPPSELILRAPSFDCYSPVFTVQTSNTTDSSKIRPLGIPV
ncbi:hypothetical protein M3Y94_01100900 [Aphelenchoides besseyi]|nr:hypothetical protein M3Y94_01100900 [Aphelenchoides besseyi]KAI6221614.1 F-actin monooxygenase [Aphelenchoides besseyi]